MGYDEEKRTGHWVAGWAAMPSLSEDDLPAAFHSENVTFEDTTIRQTIRLYTGGQQLRLRLSNALGITDLRITHCTIGLPAPANSSPADTDGIQAASSSLLSDLGLGKSLAASNTGQPIGLAGSYRVRTETLQDVTFRGRRSIDIPVGALAVSDALDFPVAPGQILSISIYLRHGQSGIITSHPGSRTQTWFARGDQTQSDILASSVSHDSSAADNATEPGVDSIFHWYYISAIEAWQPLDHYAFALLGDSITDGRCSTDNGNDRWPDRLFDRMQQSPSHSRISIINLSAGGNRILSDVKGPNVLSRLDRDVFAQPGVRYLLVFHGVNDIGTAEPDAESQAKVCERLIWAYEQIIERAHALGIVMIGATIAPFAGHEYFAPAREVTREAINNWILTGGAFDQVVDFDKVLQHPDQRDRLKAEFDSGDGLHPNLAAFQALADAFPLDLLA